jgi:hypothetical protein
MRFRDPDLTPYTNSGNIQLHELSPDRLSADFVMSRELFDGPQVFDIRAGWRRGFARWIAA